MAESNNTQSGSHADPGLYDSLSAPPTLIPDRSAAELARIDHFSVLRRLGGGAYGAVYLARDTVSGADVAIKAFRSNGGHDGERERVRANFAAVSRLHHENIASSLALHVVRAAHYYDPAAKEGLCAEPGDALVVMGYVPGAPLTQWRKQFRDGVVPVRLALAICGQIASALDYAHARRVVHRDIKPSNVIVDESSGRPVATLLDFGLAAEIRPGGGEGDRSGTRPYMAPEQWKGGEQDGRADQYALACLLHDLVSGRAPFADAFATGDPSVMEAAVAGRRPEAIPGIPRRVNRALARALAKNPEQRFPDCSSFIAAARGAASRWMAAAVLAVVALAALAALNIHVRERIAREAARQAREEAAEKAAQDERERLARREERNARREEAKAARAAAIAARTTATDAGAYDDADARWLMTAGRGAMDAAEEQILEGNFKEAVELYKTAEANYRAAAVLAARPAADVR